MKDKFISTFENSYNLEGPCLILGGAMVNGETLNHKHVKLPLKYFNRHGLISGATGTGKTKSLQILAEQLSLNGVPSMVMDMKGDLSGLARPSPGHPKIDERHEAIGLEFKAENLPIEILTLSDSKGVKLRATVSEFGPVLFSKIMNLNATQSSVVSIIFKFCDDHKLGLVDLSDFKTTLNYMCHEGKDEVAKDYGSIASSSASAILRKIVALEGQGADRFFGETSFDPDDLIRVDKNGNGYISILRLNDIQDKPHLFSTFMLGLLAEIYNTFPEEGDDDKPKFVLFIDEAHLIFKEASKELLRQLDTIVKLIRSKGVGLFFITQDPDDIPENILGQLGLKVQHALRAFTAKDRKNIKLMSQNFPITEFYDVEELLTQLGVGESLVTGLGKKGLPTILTHTMMRAPVTRMDVLTEVELDEVVSKSNIVKKYEKRVDPDSAFEILQKRIAEDEALEKETSVASKATVKKVKESPGFFSNLFKNTLFRQLARTVTRELTRGALGSLGLKTTRRRRKR